MLDQIGLGGQRLRMVNLSSAEGARFAQLCTEFSSEIGALGASPLRRETR